MYKRFALAAIMAATTVTAACEGVQPEGVYPSRDRHNSTPYRSRDSLFGPGGASLGLGGGGDDAGPQSGGGVGINGFLWRASLDTVAFMPVASADPFGGVIITDWYAMPETSASGSSSTSIFFPGRCGPTAFVSPCSDRCRTARVDGRTPPSPPGPTRGSRKPSSPAPASCASIPCSRRADGGRRPRPRRR